MSENKYNEVESYINLFKRIREKVETDEIAGLLLEQIKKDERVAKMYGSQREQEEFATPKQINYLKNLGVKFDNNKLSKKEAAVLIDQALGR